MSKKLTGLGEASANLSKDSTECEKCGATIGLTEGTCLHCFLGEGLESEGESSRETFQSVLVEAEVPDKEWRPRSVRDPGGNRTRRDGRDLSRTPAALPSDRGGEANPFVSGEVLTRRWFVFGAKRKLSPRSIIRTSFRFTR